MLARLIGPPASHPLRGVLADLVPVPRDEHGHGQELLGREDVPPQVGGHHALHGAGDEMLLHLGGAERRALLRPSAGQGQLATILW